MPEQNNQCIYCGQDVRGVRKGEHVVPQALGTTVTIRRVCNECNNNELSRLDKELVSASPLHIAAREELDIVGDNVWDYNTQLDLAIEGRLVENSSAVVQWPQVILDEGQTVFCYDIEEVEKVGQQVCYEAFRKQLITAVQTVRRNDRRPRLRWHSIPNLPKRGRFPPRVFTRHNCDDLHEGISFECRYHGTIDRNDVLSRLEKWQIDLNSTKEMTMEGVIDPEAATSYRPRWILRALVKIGINLLAYVMENDFQREAFSDAIQFVIRDIGEGPSSNECGFLTKDITESLTCPHNSHKFILQYDGNWALDCSFFGGIVGATVLFPGQNWENVRRIEIVAPLGSSDWEVGKSQILIPRQPRVTDRLDDMLKSTTTIRNVQARKRVVTRKKSI